MSRSNGSQPLPAGQALQAGGYDVNPDPRAWVAPQNAGSQNAAAQAGVQPSGHYQGQPYYQQPSVGQGQQNAPYTDPYAQQNGYYQAPAQHSYANPAAPAASRSAAQPNSANPAASYTPQFDPYVATPSYQAASPQSQTAANSYPDLRGSAYEHPAFDQWPTQAPADPRGYDLSNYGNQQNAASQPQQSHVQPSRQTAAPADWGQAQPASYAQQATYDNYQQTPQNYAGQGQAQQQDYGLGSAQNEQMTGGFNDQYTDNGEGMEDEAPRGRRGFLIAATLAGAIFVGGGLTFAYNSLLGPGSGGPLPLVKNAEGPTKVKPSDPGGKQFAHADSKVLGRLNDGGTASDVDAAGSKKVSTLVVKPDGSIEPPAVAADAAPIQTAAMTAAPAPAPVATVPGLSVISVGGAQSAVPSAPSPMEKAMAPAVNEAKQAVQTLAAAAQKPLVVNPPAAAPPKAPVVISAAANAGANTVASLADGAGVDAAAAPAPPVKKATVKKVATAAPAASALGAATAPATGSGYMAVVASVPASAKSRMDALTQWADMQQKYGPILQGKTMDVQEAKVGDKGLYHRLLVGPPGSKDQANSICSQLKTAGHTDCWVMGN